MAIITLDIPNALITGLANGSISVDRLLISVLNADASENHEKVRAQLQAFHEDEDGSPVVNGFDIMPQDCIYDAGAHQGKVNFRYKVNYSFGCSDVNRDVPLIEKSNFEINVLSHTLSIHIHDKMVRDTFEEF